MKRMPFLLCSWILLTGALLIADAQTAQPQWPGWLGPNRNGQVANVDTPATWPASLKRVWQVEVGEGYASPLVDGKRVYQHARIGAEEVVSCLDLSTGKLLWREGEDVSFTMGGGGLSHGKGPKATPVLADGMMFTHGIAGKLSARKLDNGALVWSKDFLKRFEKNRPYWGASYSPLVDQSRVYIHPGHENDGALLALDCKTGKEIWSSEVVGPSYSSPFALDFGGVRQVVEWNHEDLVGLNAKTGQVLWRFHFPHRGTSQNTPTPIFHQGNILVGGENRGIRSMALKQNDGTWTIEQRWFQKQVVPDMATAVINGDRFFGLSEKKRGQFFCLDANTGKIIWLSSGRIAQHASFLSIPGFVLALLDDGELQLLHPTADTYKAVHTYQVSNGQTWTPPVLLNEGLLIKDKNTLSLLSWK